MTKLISKSQHFFLIQYVNIQKSILIEQYLAVHHFSHTNISEFLINLLLYLEFPLAVHNVPSSIFL